MKKGLTKVLAVSMAIALLAGCGTSSGGSSSGGGSASQPAATEKAAADTSAAEGGEDKDIVCRVAITQDPGTMDPFSDYYNVVSGTLYQRLFQRKTRGDEIVPEIAESYEQIAGDDYIVHLRDNVYDQEGNHFTASDVKFCLDTQAANGKNPSMMSAYVGCDIIDDYTVEIHTNSTEKANHETMLVFCSMVTEKAYTEHDMNTDPITTGPYKLKSWTQGSEIVLEKNENYWQTDPAQNAPSQQQNADEIVWKIMSEPSQVAIAMENGELDYAYTIPYMELSRFEGNGYTITDQLSTIGLGIYYNCSDDNVFSDVRVRQAASYAIDANGILEASYFGEGETNVCYGYSNMSEFQEKWKDQDYYGYDPDKATALMAEAGFSKDNPAHILLMVNSLQPAETDAAPVIQAYLNAVGFDVEIASYDNALYQSYMHDPTQFDCYLDLHGADYISHMARYWLDQRYYDGTTVNFLKDDHLQELVEAALDVNTNSDETVDAMVQYTNEIIPMYALCQGMDHYVHRDTITDIYVDCAYGCHPGAFTYSEDY